MKNVLIAVLVLGLLVVGYIAATTNLRMDLESVTGDLEEVVRGDLTLPINATGAVRAARRVEVKSEASGAVVEIKADPGDRVTAGELLIRLDPDDEQRSADRARRDLDIAVARLEEARVAHKQAETADLVAAQATVTQLDEGLRLAEFRWNKLQSLPEGQRSEEEMITRETAYRTQIAQVEDAKARLERAELNVKVLAARLKQAEASVESARTALEDAQKRLKETDIYAPIDGVIGDVFIQIGEVIQGGKTTFTGGTVLAVVLDVDRLVVRAEVDESDVGRVLDLAPAWARPGHDGSVEMPAELSDAVAALPEDLLPTITVESFRDQEFQGVIERIFPEPKTISNVITYLVDVVITSENRAMLLPGMRAEVRFTAEHVRNVLLCPNEAIHEGPEGKLGVYVPQPGSPAEERRTKFIPVKLGLDNGAFSEIRDGLTEGMKVYVKLPAKSEGGRRRGVH